MNVDFALLSKLFVTSGANSSSPANSNWRITYKFMTCVPISTSYNKGM
jgi:hypothetical protein